MVQNVKVAGNLHAADWSELKSKLVAESTLALWKTAYEDFLMQRLATRYLRPIAILQKGQAYLGEGFTIVSIQCAIIEFLASMRAGKNYRYLSKGERLGTHEYSNSSKLFCDFLKDTPPFNSYFDENMAKDFYTSVRCKLLHEAMTGNDWKILASGRVAVDAKKKTIFRNQFQTVILTYLKQYKIELFGSEDLQKSFIRKFDHLAT